MRRDSRKINRKHTNDKTITYGMLIAAVVVIAVISVMTYKNINNNDSNKYASLDNKKINSMVNQVEDSQSTSTEMGKTVNEILEQNTTSTNNTINTNEITNTLNTVNKNLASNTTKNTTSTNTTQSKTKATATMPKETTEVKEQKKELELIKPVEGEIIKEFAKDQLLYSKTLEEWATHMGVDIKAEEGTEVVAVEAGTVQSIKNDPRYGVVITIEHEDGYQSVYSNLQTSEAVVEGEKVEKGQVIATVGKTAAFELKDEPHLHFEILKDYKQIDPMTLIK